MQNTHIYIYALQVSHFSKLYVRCRSCKAWLTDLAAGTRPCHGQANNDYMVMEMLADIRKWCERPWMITTDTSLDIRYRYGYEGARLSRTCIITHLCAFVIQHICACCNLLSKPTIYAGQPVVSCDIVCMDCLYTCLHLHVRMPAVRMLS
jgi:hypothetical protein